MSTAGDAEEIALFRETVRHFIDTEVAPHDQEWERAHIVDRSLFRAAGAAGLLVPNAPERFGGGGAPDWRFNAVLDDEFGRSGYAGEAIGLALVNDVVSPYLLECTTEEQRERWLPGLITGETIGAIAMTEPGTGSDLAGIATRATLEGDHYVLNGSKTFISNGQNADLVIVAARTSPDRHRGLTLLVVDANAEGFSRGRNLDKLGLLSQDTSELHFADVRVPVADRLGDEGDGFLQLVRNLPQERLSLAVMAVAAGEAILAHTLEYVTERKAFGTPIGSFQSSRFTLAELATEISVARVFVDDCVARHLRGELTAVTAAKAKWWTTELQVRVAHRCLQLFGGYGYMREYPISRFYVDARIQTIFGGTTEIMKEIIGRDLGV
ncbi:acyl-CoA dehydrogenase family protein [Microbacterium sp. No. 7]|uniref:acyl-CoA dehydrogenase family protein n=1 Tax=Microbacterium sp. No. 7 TaxID=1714373 RepID=UPI0006D0B8E7|nr:acyl-CoA dehydrogenase family protein [Microbacterium sp. No. 7]ALJ21874.1 acyl-CoA dehydrogenase [Microbacterium sp. No. 7]